METGLQLKTLSDELVKPRISRFKALEVVVYYVKHQLKGTMLLSEHALYHDLSKPMDLKQRDKRTKRKQERKMRTVTYAF